MGGSIFLTAFFGLFIAVGLGLLSYGLYSLNMAQKAASWPTTPGVVTASDFEVDADSDGTSYRTKISYVYNAMGREITGEKIAFGYTGSSSRNFHRDVYEALPVNTEVAVRYDPSNPDRAVLSYGVNRSIIFLIVFGAVWTVFVAGMIGMVWLSNQGATNLLRNMVIYSTP